MTGARAKREKIRSVLLLVLWLAMALFSQSRAIGEGFFRSNDVVCLIGGANVVSAQEYGYLETLLQLSSPGLNMHFRSLAHEGDTVFTQPRDYNYPDIPKQLDQAGATVVLIYFGQNEAVLGTNKLPEFVAAYGKLLDRVAKGGRRIALVSPTPFEASVAPLPDLSLRNEEVRQYALAIGKLADKRELMFLNVFDSKAGAASRIDHFTSDGIHLTPAGHWHYDLIVAEQLGAREPASETRVDFVTDALSRPDWERLRQAVVAKNRFWFAYSRPTNWAFLDGDRTEQPSSRDYRDPKIRWFPEEMQKFVPLIEEQEARIASLTGPMKGAQK